MATETDAAPQAGENAPLTQDQAQSYWNELASGGGTEDPKPAVTEETSAAEAAAENSEVEQAPELPPELKAALAKVDSMQELIGTLQHQVKSSEGRFAAVQRELASAKQAAQVVTRAPNQQAVAAAAKSPEKWARLKNEFPDWAEAIEEYGNHLLASTPVPQQQVDLAPIQQQFSEQLDELRGMIGRTSEEAKLYGAYRNWKRDINGDAFKAWLPKQSADIQAKFRSPDADDAIDVLDAFHTHSKDAKRDVAAERSERLQAAVGKPKGQATPPADDRDLSPHQMWNQEAARRDQRRQAANR